MLNRIIFILPLIVILACNTSKPLVISEDNQVAADSVEYDILISEPGFDSWAATNQKPVWYYSEGYYQNFNQLYVQEWNSRVLSSGSDKPFDFMINYDYKINYGIEIEHQLFWYFKFMQDKYNFKLLITERPLK